MPKHFKQLDVNIEMEDQRIKNILSENSEEVREIDLDRKLGDGTLPIHYACLFNSTHFFTRTDLKESQIDIPGGLYGSTPLMFTMYNLSHKAALFLLLNGADIYARNIKSSDALSTCARFDNLYGFILLLVFSNREIKTQRYLKYAEKKNSLQVENWLKNKFFPVVENKSDKPALLLCAIMNLTASLFWPTYRLISAAIFVLLYLVFIPTPIPLIFNILYSFQAYLTLIPGNIYTSLLVFMHCIFFILVGFMPNKHKSINNVYDIKDMVTDSILEDKFNPKNFCYTCLNIKEENVKHCSVCDRCILRHNHHCPFMNKCISKNNIPFFYIFVFLSCALYFLAMWNSSSKVCKFEFLICLLVSFASVIMILLNLFTCYKRDRLLMT
ncbi:Palmitoyltransferase akr1 [Nosema granulosis]|uniref:Palmitoyltransferase n=1 Tax=Nosema granulosis TaxID=83296 RepID=A0A9P6H1A7_9MICR|nr:Palmitoyltransferase akr1 [Nosema granulosis]